MHNLASTVNIDVGHGAGTHVYSQSILMRAFVSTTKRVRKASPTRSEDYRFGIIALPPMSVIISQIAHLEQSQLYRLYSLNQTVLSGDAKLDLCTRDPSEIDK